MSDIQLTAEEAINALNSVPVMRCSAVDTAAFNMAEAALRAQASEPERIYEMMSNFFDALTACYHIISHDEDGCIKDATDIDKDYFMYFFEDWYNGYPYKGGIE